MPLVLYVYAIVPPSFDQIKYSVIAEPPLLTGAVHENYTELEVAVIFVKAVGGSGTLVVVVIENTALNALKPMLFLAAILKV